MRSSRLRTILGSILILGIAFAAGALVRTGTWARIVSRPDCASTKQFITEFRITDGTLAAIPGLINSALNQGGARLEIDGELAGELNLFGPPLRRFLCEGTHRARISFKAAWRQHQVEEHSIEFTVSRPSLFHVTQWWAHPDEPSSCVSDAPCPFNVGLELSSLDPDDRSGSMARSEHP